MFLLDLVLVIYSHCVARVVVPSPVWGKQLLGDLTSTRHTYLISFSYIIPRPILQGIMGSSTKVRKQKGYHPYITPRSYNPRSSHNNGSPSSKPGPSISHFSLASQKSSGSRKIQPSSTLETVLDIGVAEQSTDDDLEQVIVAIDMRDSGTVGCSYYSAQEEKLYLLGDIKSAGNEMIDSCSFHTCLSLLWKVLTIFSDTTDQAYRTPDFCSCRLSHHARQPEFWARRR